MKKRILNLALIAVITGSIAMGCSSSKKAGGSDSTATDTTKVKTDSTTITTTDTVSKMTDTTKKDTMQKPR